MSAYHFEIEAIASFHSSTEESGQTYYQFTYTITFTNQGSVPAQLISRHWQITNALGHIQEVQGLGVIGQQPLLQPGESFQYVSGCRLTTPHGSMHGSFFFVATDGHRFDCPVPLFVLEAQGQSAPSRTLH